MKKHILILLLGYFLGLLGNRATVAQTQPTSSSAFCGTTDLTPAQALSLVQQGNLALQRKRASGAVFTNITYVPIRPHIVRRSNGTGGFNLNDMNYVIAKTNSYYLLNGFGIQFYFAGTTPDYVDNDGLYASFSESSFLDGHDANNALNQYYINKFPAGSTLGGYAYFPADNPNTTRSIILTASPEYPDDLANRLIPHELGHTFNLYHTFGLSNGTEPTDELVTRGAGANCTTAGDRICDTPADPYGMPGFSFERDINGCLVYTGTATDANGATFTPLTSNIMSYYGSCIHDFTPGQYDRMQAGLALRQSHTSYSLNAPATNVTPPTNLTATFNGASISLAWQNNANNAMGYFIERSTSPASGFIPVGGVAPDVTTFTDTRFATRTTYYYRIRPSNSTTDNLSQNTTVDTSPTPITGLTTTNITSYGAQLNWNSLGTGITYDVQYRPVGSFNWTTQASVTTVYYSISYGLTAGTTYEWQVKASGGGAYSGPVTFTTLCPMPFINNTTPARISAPLSWYGNSGQTYNLQWRPQGTTTWTTVNGLTTSTYSLTGLTSATAYEWQVQGVCSVTPASGFTSPQSFTTYACVAPTSAYANPQSGSASLSWYLPYSEPGQTFDVRYRPVGTTTWATVSSLTATTYQLRSSYSLTGLTNNTQYEWQVRSVCSATEVSAYTPLSTFTTVCLAVYSIQASPSATAATISWSYAGGNNPEYGSTYELQYRQAGSSVWTTIVGTIPFYYGARSITGLATNTTYEARMRTVCSPGGYSDYTATITFTTGCFAPAPNSLYTNVMGPSSAQFSWYLTADAATTFDLRYRPAGTPNWTTVSSLTTTGYSLTGLTNNTQYEWQVRTVCSATASSTFTPGPTFTTRCLIPSAGYPTVQVTSALVTWNQTEPGASYEIQYRTTGTTNWTTVSNLTSTSVVISGLTGNTSYEWQVRAHCSDGSYSDFSGTSTFQTVACNAPYGLTPTTTATSAHLSWYFSSADANTRYEIRYRVTGTTTWNILGNLTSSGGSGYVDLTGLSNNTQYEWQIRTVCSATESSAFTGSSYFIPQCPVPTNLVTLSQVTSARLNWSFATADANTRYEIQYRVAGTTTWTTLSNLTSSGGNGYVDLTGLPNNTQYEWQIRTFCSANESSAFTPGPNFSTQCGIPTGLNTTVQLTSATLRWAQTGYGVQYEMRYRLTGTTNWTTVSNLTSTSVAVSGLSSGTGYEWQVRTLCDNSTTSDFSYLSSFTTTGCSTPASLTVTNLSTTSARLNWSFYGADANTRYEARYRVVGTTTWTVLSNLTSNNGSGYVDLTGLLSTTQYEWQIRTICSASTASAFSSSVTFLTFIIPNPCLSMYTVKTGSWNDPTVWSCNRVPVDTDVVQIKHFITIPVNAVVFARQVGFDAGQKVIYSLNSQLKLGL